MRSLSVATLVLAAGTVGLLAGCVTPPADRLYAIIAESCTGLPAPKPGASLVVGGIEIPFKPNQPVKIGTINFTRDDARRVSDAIYALSESRKTQCAYLGFSLKGTPPPSGARILQALDGIKEAEQQVAAVVGVLNTEGADPKAAVEAAEKASANAKESEAKARASLGAQAPSVGTPIKIGLADLSDDVASGIRDISAVKASLSAVERDVQAMKRAGTQQQFSVGGFDSGGVMLTSGMKEALAERFAAALAGVPPSRVPRVAIVGFADESGVHRNNIEIGLRRAQSVAAFLDRSFPKLAEISIVSSGGVLSNDPNGRRVDLVIS
ncbi:hypothetical protein [Acidovorax sp.]|uniref:hypothetical protein n=1 Tax=Acidovorax sp. TaxID=1872122 RepID=UPI00391F88EC